ncbi:MAG: Arc family DNA-binding protein [Thermoanaerobaculia bacterium]|nr:Arc family DNA-binding protein [Thermoanaerobaculia bacterium]MCZ7652320.1 Arc family DNA-binding protein [Thermoanaerobaculia bacterium]
MAALNVRNLPAEVHLRLRQRAARHGRSMEAEARAILEEACRSEEEPLGPEALRAWVAALYEERPPADTAAALIAERRREAREADGG